MSFSSSLFEQQRADLEKAVKLLASQPADIQRQYRQVAQEIALALTTDVYTFSVQLPDVLYIDDRPTSVQSSIVRLHGGNFLNQLQRRDCHAAIIYALTMLMSHKDTIVASIAGLIGYLTGETILLHHIPNRGQIEAGYRVFNSQGGLSITLPEAEKTVAELSSFISRLRLVEKLYAGWTVSDNYNEIFAVLSTQITTQGRALAAYYTQKIANELHARWQKREIIRGLTLHIPYLDEKTYHMTIYEMVVIPVGRIPFRPEFIVGACRIEQQKVRKNPVLSQATRWQLVSQFDELIRVFEVTP